MALADYRVKGLTAADMTEAASVAALKAGNSPVPEFVARAVYRYAVSRGLSLLDVCPAFSRHDRTDTAIAHTELARQCEARLALERSSANLSDPLLVQLVQPPMSQMVFGVTEQFEVGEEVIPPILVGMVNLHVKRDVMPQVPLHDENVLQDVPVLVGARMAGGRIPGYSLRYAS